MDKGYIYILISILLLFIATSCISKEEDYNPQCNIFFSAVIGNNTKSDSHSIVYPNDIPFSVWGYKLPVNETWLGKGENAEVVFDDLQVKFYNGFWYTIQQHMWPSETYKMNFFAFSPSTSGASFSKDNGVEFVDFNSYKDYNFLYADPVTDMSKPEIDTPVQLVFRSPMSKMAFQIYSVSPSNVTINLTRLVLKQVCTSGSFNQNPSPAWYGLKDENDIVLKSDKKAILPMLDILDFQRLVMRVPSSERQPSSA